MFIQGNINLQNIVIYMQWLILISGVSLILSRIILGTKEVRNDLAKKTTRAEYEHQRLLALINSMTEAVLSIDDKGEINTYNSAALELLDTHSDLSGKKIQNLIELFDGDDNPIDIIKIIGETKYISKKTDYHILGSNDEAIVLEINISKAGSSTPITHESGYTILLRDITKQKSLEQEREDFISVVSHELRTPITVAEANVSMAQLVYSQEHYNDKKTIDSLEKAHEKIIFLSEMVNDLSTLSRAEREDKEMDIETFGIDEIITEVVDLSSEKAKQKNITIRTDLAPNISKITTSKLYLKEILQNFTSNSVKYSNKGDVTISSTRLGNGKVRIAVADNGIGLSQSDIKNVFDKFWRSENPLTRESEGTGLGLYISYKLARRIGAELGLESKLGEGSTFYIDLPLLATQKIDQANVVKNEARNILG
jgi:signal transduction histidine kinase